MTFSKASDPTKVAHITTLNAEKEEISKPNVKWDEWVKVNRGGTGLHRTEYAPEIFYELLPEVRNMSLPPKDRINLLQDLFELVKVQFLIKF